MTAFRFTCSGRGEPQRGHRCYSGPVRVHTSDHTADALARRARWHLYAGDDRAPLGWETRA